MKFVEIKVSEKEIKNRKLVCGIGINDADYMAQYNVGNKTMYCQYLRQWKSLIYGNYGQRAIRSGNNRTVTTEWLVFSVFKEWMKQQDWKNKYLDKDMIVPGNRVYGPRTCAFVSNVVNTIFHNTKDRKLPKGVSNKANGKYLVQVQYHKDYNYIKGKQITFVSLREASEYWIEHKERTVIEICTTLTDSRVIKGLMWHMELLKEESLRKVKSIEAR